MTVTISLFIIRQKFKATFLKVLILLYQELILRTGLILHTAFFILAEEDTIFRIPMFTILKEVLAGILHCYILYQHSKGLKQVFR